MRFAGFLLLLALPALAANRLPLATPSASPSDPTRSDLLRKIERSSGPEKLRCLEDLARFEASSDNPEAAIRALLDALALLAPEHWRLEPIGQRLFAIADRSGQSAFLEDELSRLSTSARSREIGLLALAAFHRANHRADAERSTLARLVDAFPANPAYRALLMRSALGSGDIKAAVAARKTAPPGATRHPEFAFAAADLDLQIGHARQAGELLFDLLANAPDSAPLRNRILAFCRSPEMAPEFDALIRRIQPELPPDELAALHVEAREIPAALRSIQSTARAIRDPAPRAAFLRASAVLLAAMNALPDSAPLFVAALDLVPGDDALRLDAAEALLAAGRPAEAVATIGPLAGRSLSDAEDRRFFELASTAAIPESERIIGDIVAGGDAVRAARWLWWLGKTAEARSRLGPLLSGDNPPLPALALHAALAEAAGEHPSDIQRQLAARDPARTGEWNRRLSASLEAEGRSDEAIAALESASTQENADPAGLTDLALALQRAGRWADALAKWEQALRLGGSAAESALPSFLGAAERLGVIDRATETAWTCLAKAPGASRDTLAELIAFCGRHNRADWIADQLFVAHKKMPGSGRLALATFDALDAAGRSAEAAKLLREITLWQDPSAESLAAWADRAERAGDLPLALSIRKQATAQTASAETVCQLAATREAALDFAGARDLYLALANRASDDPGPSLDAARFFLRYGDRPAALDRLRRARTLAPRAPKTLLELARLAPDAEALSCLEALLQATNPKPDPESDPLPPAPLIEGSETLQQAFFEATKARGSIPDGRVLTEIKGLSGARTGPADEERARRLEAIRLTGTLLARSGGKRAATAWASQFSDSPSRTEALHAAFYAGDSPRVLALLAPPKNETDPSRTLLWLTAAFRLGADREIAAWVAAPDRPELDHDLFLAALARHFQQPDADIADAVRLFDPASTAPATLWTAASLLAAGKHYREAARLGARAFSDPAKKPQLGLELARWQQLAGQARDARKTLRATLALRATDFNAPAFDALAAFVSLLAPAERDTWIQKRLASLGEQRRADPVRCAIESSILHALAGDEAAAHASLADLLGRRLVPPGEPDDYAPPASNRFIEFALAAGNRFRQWHRDSPADFIWRHLSSDPALVASRDGWNLAASNELKMRRLVLEIDRSDRPRQAALAESFARNQPDDLAHAFASTLSAHSHWDAAAAAYAALCARSPDNQQLWTGLIDACTDGRLPEIATGAVLAQIEAIEGRVAAEIRAPLLTRAARLAAESGDFVSAARMARSAATAPSAPIPHRAAAAKFLGELGHTDEAIALLIGLKNESPDAAATTVVLAEVLDAAGRWREAIPHLSGSVEPALRALDALFAARLGDSRRAVKIGIEFIGGKNTGPIPPIAGELDRCGFPSAAHFLLNKASLETGDPARAFELDRDLIRALPASHPFIEPALRRCAATAARLPDGHPQFAAFLQEKGIRPTGHPPDAIPFPGPAPTPPPVAPEALLARRWFDPAAATRAAHEWKRLGSPHQAAYAADIAIENDPRAIEPAPHFLRAELCLGENRIPEAARTLAAAYRNPATTDAKPLVEWLLRTGKYASLHAGLAPFDLTSSQRDATFAALLDALIARGRTAEAADLADRFPEFLSRIGPEKARLATLVSSAGDPERLLVIADQARSEVAPLPLAWRIPFCAFYAAAAGRLESLGRPSEALACLRTAHDLHPAHADLALALAARLRAEGALAEADLVLRKTAESSRTPSDRSRLRPPK